jgi:hypothetical protein
MLMRSPRTIDKTDINDINQANTVTHSWYDNTDLINMKTVSVEDLQKSGKTTDALCDLVDQGLIKRWYFNIIDANNIKISAKDNVAQSTGNTPSQIKEFGRIFKEKRFSPFEDILPIIILECDGTYRTAGGYKRILGAQSVILTNGEVLTLPCIVIVPSSDVDLIGLQVKLNVIENQRPYKENPDKIVNTIHSYVNAIVQKVKRMDLNIKDLDRDDLKQIAREYSASRDGYKVDDIISLVYEASGVEVPVYTSTDDSKELIRKLLLVDMNLEINPYIMSYDVKGKWLSAKDRLTHLINSINTAMDQNRSHIVMIVQHTSVGPVKQKEYNKMYLDFERANGTLKEIYRGKSDQTPPIPVIFGVINNKKITFVDESWMDNIKTRGKLDL